MTSSPKRERDNDKLESFTLTEDDVRISNVIVFRCIVTCMIMYICERNIRNIFIRRNKAKDKQQAKEAREETHVWTQHIYSVYIYGTTASLFPGRAQRLLRDPYQECQSQWTISNLPKLELKNNKMDGAPTCDPYMTAI